MGSVLIPREKGRKTVQERGAPSLGSSPLSCYIRRTRDGESIPGLLSRERGSLLRLREFERAWLPDKNVLGEGRDRHALPPGGVPYGHSRLRVRRIDRVADRLPRDGDRRRGDVPRRGTGDGQRAALSLCDRFAACGFSETDPVRRRFGDSRTGQGN